MNFRTLNNLAGWLTFAVAVIVLGAAAERTGSLWDCGEFISGAYKLQVVHPPGAPIFLLVGRLFAWVGDLMSSDPAKIAYAVNLLSAICTAFTALFVCWSTTILARLILAGREQSSFTTGQTIAILGAGLVAGLSTAFTTSIWFSAVEGEVYAMSTFFTAMTLWSVLKWYNLPDNADADRWLVFAFFSTALSIGVHLLSLLTFPALAIFYYSKKNPNPNVRGMLLAALVGVLFIVGIQSLIITGIPTLWSGMEIVMVNKMGMPVFSGLAGVIVVIAGLFWLAFSQLRKAEGSPLSTVEWIVAGVVFVLTLWASNSSGTGSGLVTFLKTAVAFGAIVWLITRTPRGLLQRVIVAMGVTVIAYMSYGMVIIRANANPPINMNNPSDPMRMLPYLNREQYGERALISGPHFDSKTNDVTSEPRYGRVGDRYEVVDEKVEYSYPSSEKSLFPRMQDNTQGRPRLYRQWIDKKTGAPTLADNIEFFLKYQVGWMYWRYFMWNFAGRQNGEQGLYAWDPSSGHWISGIDPLDANRLGDTTNLPEFQKNNQARNKYYLIPFFLGIAGLLFHLRRRPQDFMAIFAMFIITGLGIIVYSNQPPNEPRERDYVLAGSFFTYTIWIGLSVVAMYELFTNRLRLPAVGAGALGAVVALSAPLLMLTQNWDDHNRSHHYGSRDYASNFLESCKPNAIIFTYGDNDTYPLWYCQEVEGIRTDVRVVNLSLIAVDWYIDQMRRAVNNSPAIEMSIPQEKIRGFKRVQIPFYVPQGQVEREMSITEFMQFLNDDHPVPMQSGREFETYLPTRRIAIPVNREEAIKNGIISATDTTVVDTMHIDLGKETSYIIKDQLAMLDIISSNMWKRPIYWAVTCREDRLLGMENFLKLEGLALRLTPSPTPNSMDQYGIIGAGGVDTDVAFKNIMEKWRWGNFDKEKLFVDRSYMPSLQTMRLVMVRLGRQLIQERKNEQAIALADKYFQVFPTFNFPYDIFSVYMADLYLRAGADDQAGAKMREIAGTVEEQLRYYTSLSPDFQKGFQQDLQMVNSTAQTLLRIASDSKDSTLMQELEQRFAPYLGGGPELPGRQ